MYSSNGSLAEGRGRTGLPGKRQNNSTSDTLTMGSTSGSSDQE